MANIGKRKKSAPKAGNQAGVSEKETTQGGAKKFQNQAVPKVQKNRAGAVRGR